MTCAKAFDRVDHIIMIYRLYQSGVKSKLLEAISSFLIDRSQRTRINTTFSDPTPIRRGLPQGGVLSLLCFLIYINSVTMSTKNTNPSLFVDDLSLIAGDAKPRNLVRKINEEDLLRIHDWSMRNHMVFDPNKFTIINIGPKRLTTKSRYSIL